MRVNLRTRKTLPPLFCSPWQAAQDYNEALLERNQLIKECWDRGIPPTRITESAMMSKQAVYRYKEY